MCRRQAFRPHTRHTRRAGSGRAAAQLCGVARVPSSATTYEVDGDEAGDAEPAQLLPDRFVAAQPVMSSWRMAAAIRSGKRSGVQAKVGTPRSARAAAFSASYDGVPESAKASNAISW